MEQSDNLVGLDAQSPKYNSLAAKHRSCHVAVPGIMSDIYHSVGVENVYIIFQTTNKYT